MTLRPASQKRRTTGPDRQAPHRLPGPTPHELERLFQDGVAHHCHGNLQHAQDCYIQVLDRQPGFAPAWHLLGFAAFQTQQFARAADYLAQAVAMRPEEGEYHHNLALALIALERLEEATHHASQARAYGYCDADSYLPVGLERIQQGKVSAARTALQAAVAADPDSADAHHYLGVLYKSERRFADAIASCERALRLRPGDVEVLNNLGNAWRDSGHPEKALRCYDRALQQKEDFAPAHNNLGVALDMLGRGEDAIQSYQRACRLDPRSAEAHNNLGNALREQGRYREAVEAFAEALRLDPSAAEIFNNLGVAYNHQGILTEAIRHFEKALGLAPGCSKARANLAASLADLGRYEQAQAQYARLAQIEPSQPLWQLRRATICPTVFPDRPSMDRYWNFLAGEVRRLASCDLPVDPADFREIACPPPFNLQFFPQNQRPMKEAFARIFSSLHLHQRPIQRNPGKKRRIGLVVTGGHEGVFLKSMRGVVERLDQAEYELLIFCSSSGAPRLRTAIRREGLEVVPLSGRLDHSAETIRQARLDLVYFWEVGTDATNYLLPFFRLAPVQCTSWGLQVTSGVPEMDYYLSSDLVEAHDAQRRYSERLVRANTLLCYRFRAARPPAPKSRADLGFQSGQHVYVCAQQPGKFHPDFDVSMAEILRRDERGTIAITGDRHGHGARVLQTRFAAMLPDVADRIVILPRLEHQDYMALLEAADVLLDPPYFGGVNSTYDGLSLGKPIVTCPTQDHRGRYTLGCYRRMGIRECIASSQQEYVTLACTLAADAQRRSWISRQIRERSELLFEDPGAVHEHERIFRELLSRDR